MLVYNIAVVNSKPVVLMKNKRIGLWQLMALVTGNMVGSGIFLLPANLASIGSISLLSWLITTLGALCLALIFARLAVTLPQTGGPYAYTHKAFGHFMGFQTAYFYWIASWVGNAAIALAGAGYLATFFPALHSPLAACITAIVFIWLFTFTNCFSAKFSSIIQLGTTIVKIIPILLIGLVGWFYVHPHYFSAYSNIAQPPQSLFHGISTGVALTFWAFIGLESATIPAEFVDNPKRNIPLATILGTLIAAVCYIASSSAIFGMVKAPMLAHASAPFAMAATLILGPIGQWLIAGLAVIACLGCLNGWTLVQGEIAKAAALDHLFPAVFAKCNRYGMPAVGIIITSILVTALLLLTISPSLVKQFQLVILLAVFATLIPYLYTAFADFSLLKQSKNHIGNYAITLFAIGYSLWALINTGTRAIDYGCFMLLSSAILYQFIKRKGEKHVS